MTLMTSHGILRLDVFKQAQVGISRAKHKRNQRAQRGDNLQMVDTLQKRVEFTFCKRLILRHYIII